MEEGLTYLSITDGEEASWNVDLGRQRGDETSDLSVVRSFFTVSVIQFQAMMTTLADL